MAPVMTATQLAAAVAGSPLARLPDPFGYIARHSAVLAGRSVPGVDYAWNKPSVAALRGAGEVFVAQYFSDDPSKNLTPARAAQLRAAGIEVVVVWEYTATAARGGFTAGQRDASDAEAQAKACGVDGIPIYWAVDYDAPPEDQPLIDSYSDGWASVLGDDRGRNAYGGYWPLSRLKAAGKAKRLWGTPAWSGAEWATSGLVPDIMQGGVVTVGGVQCDLDAGLSADFGQWPAPSAPGRTWQIWETKGHTSLEAVGRQVSMAPASIIRHTALKWGAFDPVIFAYVNGLASGSVGHGTPIPTGGKLWVLR